MKSNWWERKALELQEAANKKDMKAFYAGLEAVYGPKPRGSLQLRALDGETVLQEKEKILNRFADHFNQLLNFPGDLADEAHEQLTQRSVITSLDEQPSINELLTAIKTTQEGNAPGRDGIPAEVWKHGDLIFEIQDLEQVP